MKWVICQNKLVTPLERIYIQLSNGVKIMDLSHTQPKLLAAEHACGRKFQTEKNTLEVTSHKQTIEYIVVPTSTVLLLFDAFEINSQDMFVVEDISW